jgi:hypothetical protein
MRSLVALSLLLGSCAPRAPAVTVATVAASPALRAGRTLTDVQWRDDLVAMRQAMQRTHKDLFHTVTPHDLDVAFQKLAADVPELDDDQITVRIQQIGALVHDAHSGVNVMFQPGHAIVPLAFARYADGVFVRRAPPELARAVGARLVRVGDVPWQDALARIDTIVDRDPGNDGPLMAPLPTLYLADPRALHGLGLSATNATATYTFERPGGEAFAITLAPSVAPIDVMFHGGGASWLDARAQSGPFQTAPIVLTYLPEARAIYMQFDLVAQPSDGGMAGLVTRLATMIDQHDPQRLVIDVRRNGGGDNTILRPLVRALICSKLDHRGGLFVLVGPVTYSAAQTFVNRVELWTDAIFVGEPTGNNVNFFADVTRTVLPHSHLRVEMSHLWWQDEDPRDRRTATFPEIAIPPGSFADYVAGRDAALDYALHAPVPMRFEDVVSDAAARGTAAAAAAYRAYLADPRHRYATGLEQKLNTRGYELLSAKDTARAVAVLAANADVNPSSANAFDSLGEADEAAGKSVDAVAAYRRSLELNPHNDHAAAAIKRLQP